LSSYFLVLLDTWALFFAFGALLAVFPPALLSVVPSLLVVSAMLGLGALAISAATTGVSPNTVVSTGALVSSYLFGVAALAVGAPALPVLLGLVAAIEVGVLAYDTISNWKLLDQGGH
jgi:hypothetical protein